MQSSFFKSILGLRLYRILPQTPADLSSGIGASDIQRDIQNFRQPEQIPLGYLERNARCAASPVTTVPGGSAGQGGPWIPSSPAGCTAALSPDIEDCTACAEAEQLLDLNTESDADSDDDDRKVDMQILFRKISTRLLPLFFVMVVMCYVDRTSLAFAAIQLNASLRFPPSVYGMGSGLFFLGYSLFQIPSNLLLRRFGGPTWLALIIGAWGLVASAFAAMHTAGQFYTLRLLLGATEAGAFPGMWFVLTTFYPGDLITFPFAVVEAGISLSHVVAAPMAAACLSLDGMGGLAGWRWLFLLEGLPTLVLAAVMYRLLPRNPETADFLSAAERRALIQRIELHGREQERSAGGISNGGVRGGLKCVSSVSSNMNAGGIVKRATVRAVADKGGTAGAAGCSSLAAGTPGSCSSSNGIAGGGGGGGGAILTWSSILPAITNKYVWYMGAIKFVRDIASFGLIFWVPTIVNSLLQEMRRPQGLNETLAVDPDMVNISSSVPSGLGRSLLGGAIPLPQDGHHSNGAAAVLLTALPFALAAAASLALAHSSQRSGERFLHISMPYILTGGALSLYTRAASRSPWLGFLVLSLGAVGVYCGSGPSLALVSELAAGPGLVVALPLYNSLGTLGGFLGPAIVGWLVQRAYSSASSSSASTTPTSAAAAAVIQGGGFGVSAIVLGSALGLAGFLVLSLGAAMGRLPTMRYKAAAAGPACGSPRAGGGGIGAVMEDAGARVVLRKAFDPGSLERKVSGGEGFTSMVAAGVAAGKIVEGGAARDSAGSSGEVLLSKF